MDFYLATIWDPSYRYPVTRTPQCGAVDVTVGSLEVPVSDFDPQATVQQGKFADNGESAEPQPSDTFATYTTSWSFKADVPGG